MARKAGSGALATQVPIVISPTREMGGATTVGAFPLERVPTGGDSNGDAFQLEPKLGTKPFVGASSDALVGK